MTMQVDEVAPTKAYYGLQPIIRGLVVSNRLVETPLEGDDLALVITPR